MKNKFFDALKKKLPGVRKQVSMAKHTTFKIGGPAEYFFIARSERDIVKAVKTAQKIHIPIFIFGGGSNLLVSDDGIEGLVVKIKNDDIALLKNGAIKAGAGVDMGKLVSFSIDKSLAGLEWAGGLPGTFGGAIRGNAGAFGGETKDSIIQVKALDGNLRIKKFNNKRCKFSYRNSIFKEKGWIILSATMKLQKGNKKELKRIAQSHIDYRKQKHPLEYGSAGSVFKNVPVETLNPAFKKEFSDKVKKDPFPIVPAAWFIIGAKLAGKQIGGAQVSTKHSNYIINVNKALTADVIQLVELIKRRIKSGYGVDLEPEVQIVISLKKQQNAYSNSRKKP